MNLSKVDGACRELEWALERGAKTVLVRPAPVAGFRSPTSPFLPNTDPFWRMIEENDIPVMFHASDSGYTKYTNDWAGSDLEMRPFEFDVFRALSEDQRPIMDTVLAAVGQGMLSRFPKVKIASIECGSKWLNRAMEKFDTVYGKMPHMFAEHPRETIKRALYVAPYWEDPLQPLIEILGLAVEGGDKRFQRVAPLADDFVGTNVAGLDGGDRLRERAAMLVELLGEGRERFEHIRGLGARHLCKVDLFSRPGNDLEVRDRPSQVAPGSVDDQVDVVGRARSRFRGEDLCQAGADERALKRSEEERQAARRER